MIPYPEAVLAVDTATYGLRLAESVEDLEAAQRLRFEVFNLELHEGLDSAYLSGLDCDPFDDICDHLLVTHLPSGMVIGTYRMQTGLIAASSIGYYSANEFDFTPFEPYRSEMVELGRACVHREHRCLAVINLLWRGIALYARARGGRYLIGCSSLSTQDSSLGWATYEYLREKYLAAPEFQTLPLRGWELDRVSPLRNCPPPPRLLRAYLQAGARICGEPAMDRDFRTIDFLTLLDLEKVSAGVRGHFLA